MSIKSKVQKGAKFALLNAACLAGLMATPALAQEAADEEVIVVTGFRASLANSTNAKREATNFTDSVFAEDIGQFPDLNIAESLNRVPGVTIEREVNGEGLRVAIRGLNTNFAKVLLNGSQIAVASSGAFDNQGVNREVDLDLFPTELFTQLDVNKSPTASLLEGGVSGTVNLRSARPFDNPGSHLTYVAQGSYGSIGEDWSPRGALIGSWTNDQFGVLVGVQAVNNKLATRGYETIGYTNPDMSAIECGAATDADCDAGGGNGFTFPDTVPVGAGQYYGVPDGTPVTAALLLANNPGLTTAQIGNALIPRLGRPAWFDGTRDRVASVVSFQWRPNENIDVYLDMMGALANRDINRRDLMVEVRGGGNNILPSNWVVDGNGVLTGGDLVNANYFLEARPYDEDLEFYNINPGASLQFGEDLRIDLQANLSRSVMFREQPTIGLGSRRGAGVVINYDNTLGAIPSFTSAQFDPNDPNADWVYVRLNLQNEKRVTSTQGMHWDATWGDERNNIRFGIAYDEVSRVILGLNNDAAWENFTCREGTSLTTGGARPACNGPTSASAIPQSTLGNYLMPGEGGFVDVDYGSFFADSNYEQFFDAAPAAGGAATGANSGLVDEETLGAYVEVNGEAEWRGHLIRFNGGTRYYTTDQTIAGSVLNAADNTRSFTDRTNATYDGYLPSLNVVAELTENVNLRFSASRTMSRQNPGAMLPNTSFSDPGAQLANQGNPDLAPYLSNNFDFGGEWYTGGEGYVGVMLFTKEMTGFTQNGTRTIPFRDLGIDFDTLSQTQRDALTARNPSDPEGAAVTVNQQVNSSAALVLNGYEVTWVQPLDFLLEGLGFTANYTRVNQTGEGAGAPPNATNTPRFTYNVTAYYETGPFSGRFSYNYQDESIQNNLTGPADGFPYNVNPALSNPQPGYRFNEARGQLDAAFRYTLESLPSTPQLTLDLINITEEPRRAYQGWENASYTYYDPGFSVLVGVRGTF